MKAYLCLIEIFCAVVLVKCEAYSKMEKYGEECKNEVGLPEDTFAKGPPNFDNPIVNNFCACIMKKDGILVDGKIVAEKAIEFATKEIPGAYTDSVKADIKKCVGKANEEKKEIDVVGALGKCIVAKYPFPK